MGAGAIWRLTLYRRVNHAFIQLSNNSLLSPECTKYSASAEGVLGNPGQPFLMLITTVCGLRGAGSALITSSTIKVENEFGERNEGLAGRDFLNSRGQGKLCLGFRWSVKGKEIADWVNHKEKNFLGRGQSPQGGKECVCKGPRE